MNLVIPAHRAKESALDYLAGPPRAKAMGYNSKAH